MALKFNLLIPREARLIGHGTIKEGLNAEDDPCRRIAGCDLGQGRSAASTTSTIVVVLPGSDACH